MKFRDTQRRVFYDRAAQEAKLWRTRDLQPSRHSAVFATEQIGTSRYLTKEGYLFCEAVPIARTDEMIYGPGEVPVQPGPDGLIRISRDAATLFNMDTLLSYQGKPITNDHPMYDVGPESWKDLAVGVVLNPRRGEGPQHDLMLADFLVTDAAAIRAINDGKVEVSCGYDAMYKETGPGRGIQTDIVGNHVALVERGRCGQRCAIGDRSTTEEEDEMRTRDNASAGNAGETTAQRARRQFNDIGKTLEELEKSGAGNAVHIHLGDGAGAVSGGDKTNDADPVAKLTKDMSMMQQSIQQLAQSVATLVKTGKGKDKKKVTADAGNDPTEEEDEEVRTDDGDGEEEDDEDEEENKEENAGKKGQAKDSRAYESSFKDTAAGVEVLVPGMKLPTFDAKRPRAATMDSMCRMRSAALDRFSNTPHGAPIMLGLTDGKGYDPLTTDCATTAKLFKSAVATQKASNNAGNTQGAHVVGTFDAAQAFPQQGVRVVGGPVPVNPHSVDNIAARHAKFWQDKGIKV